MFPGAISWSGRRKVSVLDGRRVVEPRRAGFTRAATSSRALSVPSSNRPDSAWKNSRRCFSREGAVKSNPCPIEDAAWLVLDEARLMEGASVEDPAAFGARLRRVMEKALG
jgi:HSP90 family molecular chaperone